MLTGHRSDPNHLTVTPQTRRRRKLRRQKTTISTRLSNVENTQTGTSIYQILMNTKSRVQGIGYNVKNFLFDDSRPVVLNVYSRLWLSGEQIEESETFYGKWSRIHRMTYRKQWPEALLNPKSQIYYDSDTGWGCTVRSSQMLLAHVLTRLDFPEKRVCVCFLDRVSSLLSVHNFVNSQSDKFAGEWFGPSSATSVVAKILSSYDSISLNLGVHISLDGRVKIPDLREESRQRMGSSFGSSIDTPPLTTCRKSYVGNSWEMCPSSLSGSSSFAPSPRDGFVDLSSSQISNHEFLLVEQDDGLSSASSSSSYSTDRSPGPSGDGQGFWARPVLLMIAVRLSPENEMSKSQTAALLSYMTLPCFAGVIGGPDRRCHFIIGLLEDRKEEEGLEYELLSIDPHIVQDAVTEVDSGIFQNATHPTRLSPACLCPSLAVAFLLKSQTDLDVLSHTLSTSMAGGFIEFVSPASAESGSALRPQYSAQLVEGVSGEEGLVLVAPVE